MNKRNEKAHTYYINRHLGDFNLDSGRNKLETVMACSEILQWGKIINESNQSLMISILYWGGGGGGSVPEPPPPLGMPLSGN